ncbi:hypothetical protein GCM10023149_01660 [Mucilaginibacter gynuensis]|uniref:Uncharacterized protein n=1 Tax=Mucilaginibacter gynuensis TaxID=1302236 RepID=A0ABP8FNT1_9SPHI
MITIYFPADSKEISGWKDRLDNIFLKYQLIEEPDITQPRLTDDEKQAEGVAAIEAYMESMEQLVQGWYEDRCDRYDFDPDQSKLLP